MLRGVDFAPRPGPSWPSSGRAAPARARWRCSSPASTRRAAGASRSEASTRTASPRPASGARSPSSPRNSTSSRERCGRTSRSPLPPPPTASSRAHSPWRAPAGSSRRSPTGSTLASARVAPHSRLPKRSSCRWRRLILADPHTLVLDEATSLLDPRSARPARALPRPAARRPHRRRPHRRLQDGTDADVIVVIEDGRVVERGSHDELPRAGRLLRCPLALLAGRWGRRPGGRRRDRADRPLSSSPTPPSSRRRSCPRRTARTRARESHG